MGGTDMRRDGRAGDALRPVRIVRDFIPHAEGSVLFEIGETRVICTASVDDLVPSFLRGSGQGWVTAEYGMLPRATLTRNQREVSRGRPTGRTSEIQRLIGRSMRAVTDLKALGERSIWIDCDVIQADGGTRCASITAAALALWDACRAMVAEGMLESDPMNGLVAAVSVGVVDGDMLLDLDYPEDSRADVDMNVIMTDAGEFVEVQGTAEKQSFPRDVLDGMLALADTGIRQLIEIQQAYGRGEQIGG